MAITLDEPSMLDNVLYYGLFLGAIFQIVCIAAVVFIPHSENEEVPQQFIVHDTMLVYSDNAGFG